MRTKNSYSLHSRERDEALYSAYRKLLASHDFVHIPSIMKELVDVPCSRFWVSEDRASIVIKSIQNGDTLEKMIPCRREMYFELYNRYLAHSSLYPDKPHKQIVSEIIEQPAPKFYLTPSSANVIISRYKKRKRQCLKEKKEKLRYMFM